MSEITINVSSLLTYSQRRVPTDWTLLHFKTFLEPITGIPPDSQRLSVEQASGSEPKVLKPSVGFSDATYKLSNFSDLLTNNATVEVSDIRENSVLKEISEKLENDDYNEDSEEVQRFKVTDEQYAKRTDTVLEWKRQHKIGKFGYNNDQKVIEKNAELASKIKIGDRCKSVGEGRLGTVKYVGKVLEIPDNKFPWVGVEWDEPNGKNDGSIKGKRYFQCKKNYGSFVKPETIEIGDFPPEELDLDFSDDEL